MSESSDSRPWGLLAEFATADALLAAAQQARRAGYAKAEAYSPFPVEGLADAIGFQPSRVPLWALVGAVAGGFGAYLLQWYSAVIDYPEIIGGRPLHSWPMFIPITFEMTILGGTFAAVAAFLAGSRLPRLQHPLFAIPEFTLASRNRFFLCLRDDDPAFDAARSASFLSTLSPLRISEVAPT